MPRPDPPTDPASVSERYRAFLDRARALTGTLSSEELFVAIHRETEEALEASGFYISLYDQGRDLATIVYYADKGEVNRVGVSYRGSDSEVIRTQRASMVNEDLNDRSLLVLGEDDTDVTSSAISAPMIHKGRMIGAISAQSYEAEAYSEDDLTLLQGIADLSAIAIDNAHQFAELRQRRREAEPSTAAPTRYGGGARLRRQPCAARSRENLATNRNDRPRGPAPAMPRSHRLRRSPRNNGPAACHHRHL